MASDSDSGPLKCEYVMSALTDSRPVEGVQRVQAYGTREMDPQFIAVIATP